MSAIKVRCIDVMRSAFLEKGKVYLVKECANNSDMYEIVDSNERLVAGLIYMKSRFEIVE